MVTYNGFVPYLFYEDAGAAIEWYSRVFGFHEIGRWNGEDGKIRNAEMRVGNTELWLDGGGKLLIRKDGEAKTIWIGLWVDDVDAVYRSIRSAGVEAAPPVTRQFGVEMLNVDDPFGYSWGFMRRLLPWPYENSPDQARPVTPGTDPARD